MKEYKRNMDYVISIDFSKNGADGTIQIPLEGLNAKMTKWFDGIGNMMSHHCCIFWTSVKVFWMCFRSPFNARDCSFVTLNITLTRWALLINTSKPKSETNCKCHDRNEWFGNVPHVHITLRSHRCVTGGSNLVSVSWPPSNSSNRWHTLDCLDWCWWSDCIPNLKPLTQLRKK